CIRRDNLRLGDSQILAVLLRVQLREQLTLLDFRAHVDGAPEDLTAYPEPNIRLVARLDFAGPRNRFAGPARLDGDRAHRPDLGSCGLFLLTAGGDGKPYGQHR